jgi:hypothetical protein
MADLVDGRRQHRLPGVEPGFLHGSPVKGTLTSGQSWSMSTPALPSGYVTHCASCSRWLETWLKLFSRMPLVSRMEWAHHASALAPCGYRLPQMRYRCGLHTVQTLHAPPADPPVRRLLHTHRSGPWLAHRCGGPDVPPAMRFIATYCGCSWGIGGHAAAKSDSHQPCCSPAQPGCSPLLAPLQLPVS